MLCCVKFCGGCNPRYDRGEAYQAIRHRLAGAVERGGGLPLLSGAEKDRAGEPLCLDLVKEGRPCDHLLIIGGCPACCATHEQYTVKGEIIKMWDPEQMEEVINKIKNLVP